MKIFIAVPTFENIYPDVYKAIYGLDKCGHFVVFDFVRGYDCATARNNIAMQAQRENADYVLMVDNDVVLPSDALKNLLDDVRDVTLGYYAHRPADNLYNGRTCVCKLGEFNYTDQFTAEELRGLEKQGKYKIRIHGGGAGCAFIKTDIFSRLSFPYYDWVNYPDRGILSEDLFFCEQCMERGIPIYTDTRVGCGHIFRRTQWV